MITDRLPSVFVLMRILKAREKKLDIRGPIVTLEITQSFYYY